MVKRNSRRHVKGKSYYFGKKPIVKSREMFKPRNERISMDFNYTKYGDKLDASELKLSDYNKLNYSIDKEVLKKTEKIVKAKHILKKNKQRIKSMDQRLMKNSVGRPIYVRKIINKILIFLGNEKGFEVL